MLVGMRVRIWKWLGCQLWALAGVPERLLALGSRCYARGQRLERRGEKEGRRC